MDIAEAELIWPGSFIAHEDDEASHEALKLLHLLDAAFAEALLALICFSNVRDRDHSGDLASRRKRDLVEQHEAEEEAWQGRPDPMSARDSDLMLKARAIKRIEGERVRTRRRWARGELPRGVAHHLPFMYARAFLFALDSVEKVLKVLASFPVPTAAAEARDELLAALPDLRKVRDTAHHHEDRVRGVDRRGEPLDFQPINTGRIHAPGGAIVLNHLDDTRYGCTVDDGRFAQVDVTPASLLAARDAIQQVLDSVPWSDRDHPRRSPTI